MKYLALIAVFLVLPATASAQSVDCPANFVCITPAAAKKFIELDETVKAQVTEIATLKQSITDYKDLLNKMRVEYAEKAGENTALKQNAISDRAIMEVLLKNTKKKCLPFSICL